jgi:hypothetical protein
LVGIWCIASGLDPNGVRDVVEKGTGTGSLDNGAVVDGTGGSKTTPLPEVVFCSAASETSDVLGKFSSFETRTQSSFSLVSSRTSWIATFVLSGRVESSSGEVRGLVQTDVHRTENPPLQQLG